jgi:diguanylate cyclase (GGDEF)-like protein
VAALGRSETWIPHRNPYWFYGVLWGLPVPLATLGVQSSVEGAGLAPSALWAVLLANPWQWWFALHPLLFGVLFGAVGTMALQCNARIQELLDALQRRADSDGLTGLLNHRAFQLRLRAELTRTRRERAAAALLMIDIDRFKRLNDAYGHPAGDAVLVDLASRLRSAVREYDLPARYGGEEFAVILPGMDAAGAVDAAERIRVAVADTPFRLPAGHEVTVTVSIGAAPLEAEWDAEAWLAEADRRLYAAKHSGRNRVCAAPNPPTHGTDSSGGAENHPLAPTQL